MFAVLKAGTFIEAN